MGASPSPAHQESRSTTAAAAPASATLKPGQLGVIKRNGQITAYDDNKIAVAMTKAFLAVEGNQAAASTRVHELVNDLTQRITQDFQRRWPTGGTLHIEAIQDIVELTLMRAGQHQVARDYVLYREAHRQARAEKQKAAAEQAPALRVTLHDGQQVPVTSLPLAELVSEACLGLADVTSDKILSDTLANIFDQVSIDDLQRALVMSARTLIETEPNYRFVAARLLTHQLHNEVLTALGLPNVDTQQAIEPHYPELLKRYIDRGIQAKLLDQRLADFDLDRLAGALQVNRNQKLTYLSIQTLYDRYFIHQQGTRLEVPQVFFMRVAMGLALEEGDSKNERAIEFYNVLSEFDYMASTPTLFNAGTRRSQLSSCYLTTVPDDLAGIYGAIKDNALLSKFAGGLGNDWTPVRGMGAYIKGTNGQSQGVVPFMNVADATAVAVNQGGKRKGAVCAYLETWHIDIEAFLDLRKNTGDERRRTHDMNTANWVPDLFMQRVFANADWSLFSPNEVPDLHDLTGQAFAEAYVAYEKKAAEGLIERRVIPAVTLWRKMLSMLFETGHPWVTFKDSCNLRSPQQHCGVIHSSNLCTEITLNTSVDEIAVCNLGSINLVNHLNEDGLDVAKLQTTIRTAIRMLDNVIDINYYAVPQAKHANLKHRPIGLGLMGFQDALYQQKIAYGSDAAVEFADRCMEHISYHAILASSDLAAERGTYQSYAGSLWSQGILPLDSLNLLQQARQADHLDVDRTSTLDWAQVRTQVAKQGMRNSNVMAIAPTATISNICGISQSIEPTYQNLYVKSNLSGEFTVINPYLVNDLKALGIWDDVMVNDLKYFDGSVRKIQRIPDDLKARYATAFELDPRWLVEAGSRRQKWLDQAQSLNLYMAAPSGKKLDSLYRMAWVKGLKTTYYLRSLGATNVEKSTVHDRALNAVQNEGPKVCSIEDPDCEACQ